MAALSLSDIFGTNATLNNGTVTFELSDLADSGLDADTTKPSSILAALILNLKANQSSDATDNAEVGIVIGDSFKMFARDDSQIEYQYPVSIYAPNDVPALDPDDVIG